MSTNKGISLIVLVITIIVMIILAGAIILSLNNAGIIGNANKAVVATNEKQVQVLADTIWADVYFESEGKPIRAQLQQAIENGLVKNGVDLSNYIVVATLEGVEVETFDRANWECAYTYTQATDQWSTKILKGQQELTGDIIVKFYRTEEKVTPPGESISNLFDTTISYTEGNAYKVLIEGNGDMGALMSEDMSVGYAWQLDLLLHAKGQSTSCITPYIQEIIIEDGVTNVSMLAFMGATSLKRVTINSTIEKIDHASFALCDNLECVISPTLEEWNNIVIRSSNYKLIDAEVFYDYRTKVERLANEGWKKAYQQGVKTESKLQTAVMQYLQNNEVDSKVLALYNIKATTNEVNVSGKETTLGATILSGTDYGKTVNYTANGINSWQVLYKQIVGTEEYVYLIASENAPASALPTKLIDTVANGGAGATIKDNYIYWEGTNAAPSVVASGTLNSDRWMAKWSNYATYANGRCITYFLDEGYWETFKNTIKYGDNVVGTIGTPTVEMIVASWNQRSTAIGDTENSTLTLGTQDYGYDVNGAWQTPLSRLDKLYTGSPAAKQSTWLASPSYSYGANGLLCLKYNGSTTSYRYGREGTFGVRPVVCLKSSMPVNAGVTGDVADIILK